MDSMDSMLFASCVHCCNGDENPSWPHNLLRAHQDSRQHPSPLPPSLEHADRLLTASPFTPVQANFAPVQFRNEPRKYLPTLQRRSAAHSALIRPRDRGWRNFPVSSLSSPRKDGESNREKKRKKRVSPKLFIRYSIQTYSHKTWMKQLAPALNGTQATPTYPPTSV
ncbi:hypothetical protein F4861DRAFT_148931 [Xylaria intraflava]|nr:hypothetical protein F4861DRAFT_148931 [Xylaria intraflava]